MKALLKKEWRENRMIPLWTALLLALSMVSLRKLAHLRPEDMPVLLFASWIFAGVFAASGLISREVGNGTLQFLMTQPLSRSRVWWAKVAAGLMVLAASMLLTSLVWAAVQEWLYGHGAFDHKLAADFRIVGWMVCGAIVALGLTLLISTLLDRSISSAMVAVVVGVALLIPISYLCTDFRPVFARDDAASFMLVILTCAPAVPIASYFAFTRGESLRTRRRFFWAGGACALSLILCWTGMLAVHSWAARFQRFGSIVDSARLSPHGRKLALRVLSGGRIDPFSVPQWDRQSPWWSSHGYFGDHLVIENPDGSGSPTVLPGGSSMMWSPDGRYLFYQRQVARFGLRLGESVPVLYDTYEGQLHSLSLQGFSSYLITAAAWSPDGRWLAVQAGRWYGDSVQEIRFFDLSRPYVEPGGNLDPNRSIGLPSQSSVLTDVSRAGDPYGLATNFGIAWTADSRYLITGHADYLLALDPEKLSLGGGDWDPDYSDYSSSTYNPNGVYRGPLRIAALDGSKSTHLTLTSNLHRAHLLVLDGYPAAYLPIGQNRPIVRITWSAENGKSFLLDLAAAIQAAERRSPDADTPDLLSLVKQYPGGAIPARYKYGSQEISPDGRFVLAWVRSPDARRRREQETPAVVRLDLNSGAAVVPTSEMQSATSDGWWLPDGHQFYFSQHGRWWIGDVAAGRGHPAGPAEGMPAGVTPGGQLALLPDRVRDIFRPGLNTNHH